MPRKRKSFTTPKGCYVRSISKVGEDVDLRLGCPQGLFENFVGHSVSGVTSIEINGVNVSGKHVGISGLPVTGKAVRCRKTTGHNVLVCKRGR
jgi:hypothetical protein